MIAKKSLPLVTVVTPSFNQGRYIEETILSVLNQDYPNIEYLVIDGGSTDNTLDVLRNYEGQLTWISEPDRGQSHAINKGFRMARGEILCWLNSDDTYEAGALRMAVDYFTGHPDIMMVCGGANLIDDNGNFLERITASLPFDLWSVVYLAQNIPQPATFFRKCIFDAIGMLDENLHWCMDWELWIRIGSRFKVDCVEAVLANCRFYLETKTSTGGFKRWQEIVSVQRKYGNWTFPYGLLRAGFGSIHMLIRYNYPSIYQFTQGLINYLKHKSLNDYYSNYHGVYADGWLGKKARFMFPVHADSSALQFTLQLQQDGRLFPNSVIAMVDNREVARISLPSPGQYKLRVPYDRSAAKPTEVELIFSRSLPRDDHRRLLACMLVKTEFIP